MNAPETEQRVGRWTLHRGPRAALDARDRVAPMLGAEQRRGHGDALLVVSELTANASEYGTSDTFRLEVEERGSSMRVLVVNEAAQAPPAGPHRMPPPDSPRGRGLAVVERIADDLQVHFDGSVVTVSASVGLGPEPR